MERERAVRLQRVRAKRLDAQAWHGPHTWKEPYRPPFGWASWQYVWDARVATGLIDAKAGAWSGRGMENIHMLNGMTMRFKPSGSECLGEQMAR